MVVGNSIPFNNTLHHFPECWNDQLLFIFSFNFCFFFWICKYFFIFSLDIQLKFMEPTKQLLTQSDPNNMHMENLLNKKKNISNSNSPLYFRLTPAQSIY